MSKNGEKLRKTVVCCKIIKNKWYQENIGQHEQRPDDKENNIDFPYLSDNVVYQLRCSLYTSVSLRE